MNSAGIGMTSNRTRQRMIDRLRQRGIADERVLQAMAEIPRHLFIDEALAHRAYEDDALPIKYGQTISQPYVVARMTEEVIRDSLPGKVLELGTGSGYQAAVLGQLAGQVFSVERIDKLTRSARRLFIRLGYQNIRCKTADGHDGWPSEAPFDTIIITAAPETVPFDLLDQLVIGGKMILPVGDGRKQKLLALVKQEHGYQETFLGDVIFVPLLEGVVR
ncbi:protein-L-isoaspartate(D-aspartate) O-methyltransferase [Marinicella meishanensis]|uniref:protein-L-isoaspartate(D-aspartate) O-methyltransferase n=1 Tax=Marinicella meishanensis TaxID=2873263 RepID=UPI001CC07BEF|nr:protein-L-isoaspartate(D-aspartate) O-methyltransferase [Marinicella sp. NBU2979]